MLGPGAHYKPSGTYVFIVLRDFVQKQIVAVEQMLNQPHPANSNGDIL